MENEELYFMHCSPIFRDHADFIVDAYIGDDWSPKKWEQLWARKISENLFELLCIPFAAYGISLLDKFDTAEFEGKEYILNRVIETSGHYTIRVSFAPLKKMTQDIEKQKAIMTQVLNGLRSKGAKHEAWGGYYLALDIPDISVHDQVTEHLREECDKGHVNFEVSAGPNVEVQDS